MSAFVTAFTDEWGDTTYTPTTLGTICLVVLIILLLLIGAKLFASKKERKAISTKQIAFSAMAIALAFVLSFVKLFDMPMGGAVTLCSMLFITIIGYWFGFGGGLAAAIAYGVLQLIIDPYILSIPQMLVDYIFAFGALGLSGLFCDKKFGLQIGYVVGVLGRYFFAFLSGWIFFGMYAPDTFPNAAVYSLAYNGAYLGVEAVITLVLISVPAVSKALARIKVMAES